MTKGWIIRMIFFLPNLFPVWTMAKLYWTTSTDTKREKPNKGHSSSYNSPRCWIPSLRFRDTWVKFKVTELLPSDWLIRYLFYFTFETGVPGKVAVKCFKATGRRPCHFHLMDKSWLEEQASVEGSVCPQSLFILCRKPVTHKCQETIFMTARQWPWTTDSMVMHIDHHGLQLLHAVLYYCFQHANKYILMKI